MMSTIDTNNVMKLALEALKELVAQNETSMFAAQVSGASLTNARSSITALREALAEQPAQQGCMRCNTPKKCALYGCSPLTWPSEKPAQQEPVAGQCRFPGVAWSQCDPAHVRMVLDNPHEWKGYEVRYLYDHPPAQRKPLTDEEIWKNDTIMSANSGYGATFETLREIVRAIEAAHGIKENT